MGKHLARYSVELLPVLAAEVFAARDTDNRWLRVLDPMAGTGERLREMDTQWRKWAAETGDIDDVIVRGVEIETAWDNIDMSIVEHGNAMDLRANFRPGSFEAIVTSPTYGNRYADHHNNRDTKECKRCKGSGSTHEDASGEAVTLHPCPACEGAGRVLSTRRSYRHNLGEELHPENTGQMQWGDDYRRIHLHVLCDIYDLLVDGGRFVLNISDHIRGGEIVEVSDWYVKRCKEIGFKNVGRRYIGTPRDRGTGNGANLRVDAEQVITFVKPKPRAKKAS